jgi:hypothetical protein
MEQQSHGTVYSPGNHGHLSLLSSRGTDQYQQASRLDAVPGNCMSIEGILRIPKNFVDCRLGLGSQNKHLNTCNLKFLRIHPLPACQDRPNAAHHWCWQLPYRQCQLAEHTYYASNLPAPRDLFARNTREGAYLKKIPGCKKNKPKGCSI